MNIIISSVISLIYTTTYLKCVDLVIKEQTKPIFTGPQKKRDFEGYLRECIEIKAIQDFQKYPFYPTILPGTWREKVARILSWPLSFNTIPPKVDDMDYNINSINSMIKIRKEIVKIRENECNEARNSTLRCGYNEMEIKRLRILGKVRELYWDVKEDLIDFEMMGLTDKELDSAVALIEKELPWYFIYHKYRKYIEERNDYIKISITYTIIKSISERVRNGTIFTVDQDRKVSNFDELIKTWERMCDEQRNKRGIDECIIAQKKTKRHNKNNYEKKKHRKVLSRHEFDKEVVPTNKLARYLIQEAAIINPCVCEDNIDFGLPDFVPVRSNNNRVIKIWYNAPSDLSENKKIVTVHDKITGNWILYPYTTFRGLRHAINKCLGYEIVNNASEIENNSNLSEISWSEYSSDEEDLGSSDEDGKLRQQINRFEDLSNNELQFDNEVKESDIFMHSSKRTFTIESPGHTPILAVVDTSTTPQIYGTLYPSCKMHEKNKLNMVMCTMDCGATYNIISKKTYEHFQKFKLQEETCNVRLITGDGNITVANFSVNIWLKLPNEIGIESLIKLKCLVMDIPFDILIGHTLMKTSGLGFYTYKDSKLGAYVEEITFYDEYFDENDLDWFYNARQMSKSKDKIIDNVIQREKNELHPISIEKISVGERMTPQIVGTLFPSRQKRIENALTDVRCSLDSGAGSNIISKKLFQHYQKYQLREQETEVNVMFANQNTSKADFTIDLWLSLPQVTGFHDLIRIRCIVIDLPDVFDLLIGHQTLKTSGLGFYIYEKHEYGVHNNELTAIDIKFDENIESDKDIVKSTEIRSDDEHSIENKSYTAVLTITEQMIQDKHDIFRVESQDESAYLPDDEFFQAFPEVGDQLFSKPNVFGTAKMKDKYDELIENHCTLFSETIGREPALVPEFTMEVDEQELRKIPRPRIHRQADTVRPIMCETIELHRKNGIIDPSTSEFASPVIMVGKKGKKYRMCIDYRIPNKYTTPLLFPLPYPKTIFQSVQGAKFFATADIVNAFNQLSIRKEYRKFTSFICEYGQFEFNRLPFGVKNGPSFFQHAMSTILAGLIGVICFIFIDDILIFAETEEQLISNCDTVFQRLKDHRITLKGSKCNIGVKEAAYLGFKLTGEGICHDPERKKALLEIPLPQTMKALNSFLGFTNYFRDFIRNYANYAKPLYDFSKSPSETKSNQLESRNDRTF